MFMVYDGEYPPGSVARIATRIESQLISKSLWIIIIIDYMKQSEGYLSPNMNAK